MCIIGGTSLATPLTAALEAVTGVSATTPAWTYSDAGLLNDVVSGSDGSCPSGWYLICNSASAWDGPTGNGAISGDVTTGAPGFGGSASTGANATDVTLSGGLYPNGEATSYDWQYWPSGQSAASATSTQPANSSGSTLQSVSTTICASLTPGTTYDFQLVANNASGSETGYQGSFTTAASESAPTPASAPAISGSAQDGQTLTGDATWNDASCNSAPSYAWQESSSSAGPWTTVTTAQSYPLTPADDGQYLRFVSTESNTIGSTSATSAVIGPVTEPAVASSNTTSGGGVPPTTTTTAADSATTPAGSVPATTTTSSSGAATTTTSLRFYRCSRTCTLINTHGAKIYTPVKADYGHYIKAVTTVVRIAGDIETETTTTRWIGPVSAPSAGSVGVGSGARVAAATTIRGSTGTALAQVRVARRRANRLTLVVQRRGSAPTQMWAYVIAGDQVVSATVARSLNRPATLSFTLKRGQTIRLVAVRT
jgi:hypothetical protein